MIIIALLPLRAMNAHTFIAGHAVTFPEFNPAGISFLLKENGSELYF
jgi:hypothetical protein